MTSTFSFLKFYFFTCFIFSFLTADELPFTNNFTHRSGNAISEMEVIGERCSGTNYVRALVQKNFIQYELSDNTNTRLIQKNRHANKHFFPWLDLPAFQINKQGKRIRDLDFLNGSNSCLFILAVRDPYDWLRSFYAQPHHVLTSKMLGKGFLHFIQHEWRAEDNNATYPDHWNPYDERPFLNVLELRKYKTLNYLQTGLSVDNFLVVQYEQVAQNPSLFIDFISEYFNMKKTTPFHDIESYKDEEKKDFQKKEYKPFNSIEFQFINNSIDWPTEKLIGYYKINSLEEVNARN